MSPFQKPSKAGGAASQSSSCRCSCSSWSCSTWWCWPTCSSKHTSAHVQTPPPTLKMLCSYFILFHDWVVAVILLLFKTVSIHELSQDKSPRSTKVESKWPVLLDKEGRRSCYKLVPPLTNLKRRPNCYTSLAEPRCYPYNFQNWMLHFFYFLSEWADACNCTSGNGRVELNEADFDSSLPFSYDLQLSVECPDF